VRRRRRGATGAASHPERKATLSDSTVRLGRLELLDAVVLDREFAWRIGRDQRLLDYSSMDIYGNAEKPKRLRTR
jgi:hypothetical protein